MLQLVEVLCAVVEVLCVVVEVLCVGVEVLCVEVEVSLNFTNFLVRVLLMTVPFCVM